MRSISATCASTRASSSPFQRAVARLSSSRRLLLDRVVERLLRSMRAHPRDQRRMLERLGQIVVAAGIETLDESRVSALAVTRITGMNAGPCPPSAA